MRFVFVLFDCLCFCSLLLNYTLLISLFCQLPAFLRFCCHFFAFCVTFTNSYTFGIMSATKYIPFWFSHMLALLPPLHIFFIFACFHFMNVLCSFSILLNRILRLLTIPSSPSFNYSALHPNLSLALLFFACGLFNYFVSDAFYSICLSYYFLKLLIYFFFNYHFTFIILFPDF